MSDVYMNIKSTLTTVLWLNLLNFCGVKCLVYCDTFTGLTEGAACTSRMKMDSMIHDNYLQASGQANKYHIAVSTRKQLRSIWTLEKKKSPMLYMT